MRWLVIGAGVSGLGAAKLLRKKGEIVRLSDSNKLQPKAAAIFKNLGVELCDGGHELSHLKDVTAVVISPGLPPNHPLLVAAKAKNLPVLSEIDLALKEFSGTLIAVTGTNGKSTTCAMLGYMLEKAGKSVSVGANFGDPPSAILAENRMRDYFVAELSSYQLEMSSLVAPRVAIFTSFSHDHLSRHGSLAGYLAAKWRVFEHMPSNGLAVLPEAVYLAAKKARLPQVSTNILLHYPSEDRRKSSEIPGYFIADGVVHYDQVAPIDLKNSPLKITDWQNQVNAGFATAAAAYLLGCSYSDAALWLGGFKGLPHRCELVGYIQGNPVINDSKSTNVESTLAALTGQKKPVLLLMGGKGKEEAYAPLLAVKSKIRALVSFGASGNDIANALAGSLEIHRFLTLKDALGKVPKLQKDFSSPILFSPGCASFDEFDNFEHRGNFFKSQMLPFLDSQINETSQENLIPTEGT
jgi:UDP-N-acetylmuramoylalanine--D-glutamate ligase